MKLLALALTASTALQGIEVDLFDALATTTIALEDCHDDLDTEREAWVVRERALRQDIEWERDARVEPKTPGWVWPTITILTIVAAGGIGVALAGD